MKCTSEIQEVIEELAKEKLVSTYGIRYFIDNDRNMLVLSEIKGGFKGCTHIRIAVEKDSYTIKCYRIKGYTIKVLLETPVSKSELLNFVLKYVRK